MRVGSEFVGVTELPWGEGIHRGADVTDDVDQAMRQGRWTLSGLAESYKFYSADILQYSGVITHPVDLFWAENNLPMNETPYLLEMPKVILEGLPVPLNHSIYACPTVHAKRLFTFLDRFAVGNAPNILWESVHQSLTLVDWKLVNSMSVVPEKPPTVPVELYGLTSRDVIYHWVPPRDLWKEPITLRETFRKNQHIIKPKRRPFSR